MMDRGLMSHGEKRSRGERSTDTGGGMSISVRKILCSTVCDLVDKNRRWKEKKCANLSSKACFEKKKKKEEL